jgi:hypothetical protein
VRSTTHRRGNTRNRFTSSPCKTYCQTNLTPPPQAFHIFKQPFHVTATSAKSGATAAIARQVRSTPVARPPFPKCWQREPCKISTVRACHRECVVFCLSPFCHCQNQPHHAQFRTFSPIVNPELTPMPVHACPRVSSSGRRNFLFRRCHNPALRHSRK